MESDPGARSIQFPAVLNGVAILATAIGHSDQVTIVLPDRLIEIELHVWDELVPKVMVLAHSHVPPR